jgi:hypothetical protein
MQVPDNNQPPQDEALDAPLALVSALKRLPQEPLFVPPTVDEAVLRASRRHLGRPPQARLGWLRLMPWVAAAAGIVLLAAIPRFFKQSARGPAHDSALARRDVNQGSRVDILDAFALARQLKQGGARNLQWDVNGDGVGDERDVAAIAARAVRLERGGRS